MKTIKIIKQRKFNNDITKHNKKYWNCLSCPRTSFFFHEVSYPKQPNKQTNKNPNKQTKKQNKNKPKNKTKTKTKNKNNIEIAKFH